MGSDIQMILIFIHLYKPEKHCLIKLKGLKHKERVLCGLSSSESIFILYLSSWEEIALDKKCFLEGEAVVFIIFF